MTQRLTAVVALQAAVVVACIAGSAAAAFEGSSYNGPATIQVTFKQRGVAKQTFTDTGNGFVSANSVDFTMGGFGEFPSVTLPMKATRGGRIYVVKNPADKLALNGQMFSVLTASGFYGDVKKTRVGGSHRVSADATTAKSVFTATGRGTVPVEGPAVPFTFRIVEKVNGEVVLVGKR